MALTDQPYLPLYVNDWMNNSKLKLCSPQAHGVMINVMCLMHKEEDYGKILLKQKFKQSNEQVKNFASQISKQTSFDLLEIFPGLDELISEKVLIIDGDLLICNRMVKDAETSIKRANSGKNGGLKTQGNNKKFAKEVAKAKPEANTENAIVIENTSESDIVNENASEKKHQSGREKNQVKTPGLKAKEIVYPWDDNFKMEWDKWRKYLKEQFRFSYKGELSEQSALKKLTELSNGIEATAIAIIEQSISNGWKGIFELKNTNNGANQFTNKNDATSAQEGRVNGALEILQNGFGGHVGSYAGE